MELTKIKLYLSGYWIGSFYTGGDHNIKNSTRIQLSSDSVGSNSTGSHLPTFFAHSFTTYPSFEWLKPWPNVGPDLCPSISPIIGQVDRMVRKTFREDWTRNTGEADAKPSKPPLESEASHPTENVAISPFFDRASPREKSPPIFSLPSDPWVSWTAARFLSPSSP